MNENEILGFDPTQLSVFEENSQENYSQGNSLIYRTRPRDSKSEDGVYRSTIKVIYNPFDFRHSVIEQQSYAMQDNNGWFTVVSSLTNNDKNCPIFKGWKKCHFSEAGSALWKQAALKKDGGNQLFDKRFARYVTIQVLEDKNQPDLEGKYMIWKMPKSIWDIINAKMKPATESKRASIPIMDFLFGRAIELEVTPGPGNPGDERYTRETKYTGEITDEIVSCVNPDKTSLLTDDEQDILDTYVSAMMKVWKCKDPETREDLMNDINQDPNTGKLKEIYKKVIEKIKGFCPNVVDEVGYKEWTPEVKARVDAWLNVVLSGNNPSTANEAPAVLTGNTPETVAAKTENPFPMPDVNSSTPSDDTDDLPF